jgi:ATP-binding cassette subfamily C protein
MQTQFLENIESYFELAIAQKKVVADENRLYYLEEGAASLFFRNKSKDEQFSRMRFINEYTAPCLIPIPAHDTQRDLVLSASAHSKISVIQVENLPHLPNAALEKVASLVDQMLLKGLTYSDKPAVTFAPVKFAVNEKNVSNVDGQLHTSTAHDVNWIITEEPMKLFDLYDLPKCYAYPITQQIWFFVKKDVKFEILDTLHLIRTKPDFFADLLSFWSVIFNIDSQHIKDIAANSIRQVYANVESNKGNNSYSQGKLLNLVAPFQSSKDTFTESDPLMGCLTLIGKHEKIIFQKGGSPRERYSPLENILLSSKVRARKVQLHETWYKSNNGAYLAYTAQGHDPVAMIPNGESAYKAISYAQKTVTSVTKENVSQYEREAYSFFSSFPSGKITGKTLLSFGIGFIKKDLTYFFIIGAISAILALLIPIIIGYIFDNVIPNSSTNELAQILILLVTVAISMGLLNFAQSISVLRLEGVLTYKMQSAVWDRLLSLKLRFFHLYSAGDLAERSMGVEKIRGILSGSVLTSLISFCFSIFYLALLFYYNVKLALIALALGLTIVTFTIIMSYFGFKHVKVIRYLEVVLSGFLFQIINGIGKIRVTSSNERAFSQWVGRYSVQKQHYLGKRKINIAGEVFGSFFPIFSAIFIFWQVHKLLTSGVADFTVGNYISFNNAFLCFQGALLQMSMSTVPLLTIKPIFDTFKPIIEAESEYSESKKDPGKLEGEITVSNLSFRYSDDQPMILDNVNFKIHKGEYVALVGGSGSGKSTILRLLLGFEQPVCGQIFYDNMDMNKVDIRDLRCQMGVVLQNGKLMQGSLLYNIIGSSTLTEDDAWEAARKAGCAHEIEVLKDKMHTEVFPGESSLSGGQVQRIIIARALAKKPKIMFFDEATSALDNATQKIVTDSIDKMSATRVVIAHRLSTIMNASRIIVLNKGQIVEIGTYNELIEKGGFFANLAKRQLL